MSRGVGATAQQPIDVRHSWPNLELVAVEQEHSRLVQLAQSYPATASLPAVSHPFPPFPPARAVIIIPCLGPAHSSNPQSLKRTLSTCRSISRLQQSGQGRLRFRRCPPASHQQPFSQGGGRKFNIPRPTAPRTHTIWSPRRARFSTAAQTTSKCAETKQSSVSLRNTILSCSTSVGGLLPHEAWQNLSLLRALTLRSRAVRRGDLARTGRRPVVRAFAAFACPAGRSSVQRSPFPTALPSNRTVDAVETIHFLKKSGKQVAFVTNNATKSRKEYLKKVSGPYLEAEQGKTPFIAC